MAFAYRGNPWALKAGDGMTNGWAIVDGPFRPMTIIFSDGAGWEHVSVSTRGRCPNWEEMSFVKDLFWAADDVVMQLHVAKKNHINVHPYCLHLWRPIGQAIPQPPSILVGLRTPAQTAVMGTPLE